MTANKALIAAVSDDTKASLSSMVLEAGLTDVSVTSGKNLRDLCAEHDYDVVISVFPFEGEFGAETAAYISKTFNVCQVIFVPSKVYDEVCAKLSGTGAVILPKSSPRELAVNSIRCAAAMKNKMDDLRSENKMLRDMVNEMKLVNRAKCVLIEYLKISEKEAHRQIQKRSMDQRVTLTEVAADILKTYEYR